MYQTVNTSQYTLTKNEEQTQTLKAINSEVITKNDSDFYHTVKSAFEENQGSKPTTDDYNDESMCDTMIINYDDTLADDETEKSEGLFPMNLANSGQLSQSIQKEIACLNKGTLDNNLTKEDIEQRLAALKLELEDSMNVMKLKYSRNKEKIFNAIQLKRKNHSIF